MNIFLLIAAVLLLAVVMVGRQVTRTRVNQARSSESRRYTLVGELRDLGLGIAQVQGYINAMKPAKDQSQAEADKLKQTAQNELDQAKALQAQVTAELDEASSDSQLDAASRKMEQARHHIRSARHLSHLEDEDQD